MTCSALFVNVAAMALRGLPPAGGGRPAGMIGGDEGGARVGQAGAARRGGVSSRPETACPCGAAVGERSPRGISSRSETERPWEATVKKVLEKWPKACGLSYGIEGRDRPGTGNLREQRQRQKWDLGGSKGRNVARARLRRLRSFNDPAKRRCGWEGKTKTRLGRHAPVAPSA